MVMMMITNYYFVLINILYIFLYIFFTFCSSVFTNFQGRTESWNGGDALHTVQVLRTSEIDLDGTLVKLFLISGPIEYEGCGWVPQHDTSPLKETHDDSVNSRTSTRQGRHRRIKSSANLTERAASPSPSPSTPSSSSRGIWSMFTTKAFSISAPNSSTSSSRSSDAMPLSQSFSGRPTFSRESEDQLSDDNDDDHMEEVDEHDEEDKDYGAAVIGSSVKETENVIGTEQSAVNASDDTSATVAITDGHSGSNGKNFHINKLINLHNISSSNRLFSEQPLFGSTRSRSRSNSSVSAKPQADCDDRAQDDEARKKKFSFQDFVQKMKHKSAIYLVRKIKKFVDDINANGYSNNIPQSVHYFLDEVMVEIHTHEQWKNASDTELDNARESLEKYVMTKIHGKVFSPDVEDLQQDNNLASRLSTFRLLKPENLDIDPMVISDPSWNMALEELKKINKYRAPRDKMICVSNCCRILFGILERISPNEAASADTFLPVLIYLVLKANPPHMHSNLKYIMDFRNPNKMISEAGYFLTNLQSAVVFWENLDHTSLTMEKSEFDRIAGIKTTLFEDEFEMEHGVERDDDDDENNDSVRATIDNSATENEDVAPIQPLPPEEGVMSSQTPVTPAISPIEIMEHQKSSASSSSSSLETSDEETKISVTLKQERQSHDRIDLEAERRKAVANFLSTVQDQWEHSHKEVSSKFIDISSDSLRVGDISELLFQYQILYRFHATIMEHICKHGGGREERLKD